LFYWIDLIKYWAMRGITEIDRLLKIAEKELARLDQKRSTILEKIKNLHNERESSERILSKSSSNIDTPIVANFSPQDEKIHLFQSLFRGREDVYPRRFESLRTGKTGYQPACRNEWIKEICKKPKVSCKDCENREFLPVTDEVIRNHLLGNNPNEPSKRDFTIGVYPLLLDETCWFLAVDFDKSSWMEDVSAFLKTCRSYNVPFALERSRSGKGGHVWIFFAESIPASLARKLGSLLLTETMERRPEVGFESYDRFFPSQDTLPKGGLGNLDRTTITEKTKRKR